MSRVVEPALGRPAVVTVTRAQRLWLLARGLLVVAVGGLLLAVVIAAAERSPLHFDEALHLNLATTLADSGRYASFVGGQYLWFHPWATAGPTVIGPTALAIRLAGPEMTTVRGWQIMVIGLALGPVFLATRRLANWATSLLFLVTMIATPLVLHLGLSALGEFTASVFLIAALAALDRAETTPHGRGRWLGLSGVVLGLALLAHSLAILLVAALVAVAGLDAVRQRRPPWRAFSLTPAIIALALAAGWRGLQIVTVLWVDRDGFAAWSAESTRWTLYLGKHYFFWPLAPRGPKLEQAFTSFGLVIAALLIALIAWIVVRYRRPRPSFWDADDRLARRVLALAATGWLGWFLLLSGEQTSVRHLLIGVVLAELFVVQTIYLLWRGPGGATGRPERPVAPRLLAAVLMGLLTINTARGAAWNVDYLTAVAPVRDDQAAVAAWVARSVPPDAQLAGWGWFVPWDIAFLTKRVPRRVEVTTTELVDVDWLIVVPELAQTGNDDGRLRGMLARQATLAFQAGAYEVYAVRRGRGAGAGAVNRAVAHSFGG